MVTNHTFSVLDFHVHAYVDASLFASLHCTDLRVEDVVDICPETRVIHHVGRPTCIVVEVEFSTATAEPMCKDGPALGITVKILGVLLAGVFYQQTLSGDVWWHLMTGRWIIEHHALPHSDPFSFTASHAPVMHEWAWQVLGWLVYSRISHAALAYLSVALITSAFLS